jgi:serine/threonine protein kinase/tetratricopeptide (TPR) repeat protein
MGTEDDTIRCPQCSKRIPTDSYYCKDCGSFVGIKEKTRTYTPAELPQFKNIEFSPGQEFGARYRIIEEVGRGGMGLVYKAEDVDLGITVALKMIRPEFSSDSRFLKSFKNEMLLARSISHENVIRIHDMGEVDKIKYISMEFIKGENLKELIRTSGKLSIDTAVSIAQQICEALRVAHKKGIVHRDLKPSNIMVDTDGGVHTMDFGVAKSSREHDTRLQKDIIGTPRYFSPEQAKGEKVDHRTDIYSLGIILYEMVTGLSLYDADDTIVYLHKHIYEPPPPPSKRNEQIPAYLEKIILKCLEKDKNKRYQGVDEILLDLGKKETQYITRYERRRRRWYYGLAAAAVVVIAAAGFFLLMNRESPSGLRKKIAVMMFENLTGEETFGHWSRLIQEFLNIDLGQSKFMRVLADDRLFQILEDSGSHNQTQYSSDILARIKEQADVDVFVLGSFGRTEAEEEFWISVKLRESGSTDMLDAGIVRGSGINSFDAMVDDLTRMIKTKLNFNRSELAADIDRDIGEITSRSTEALLAYSQARRHYQERRDEECVSYLQAAIKSDPEFVQAHHLMSKIYWRWNDVEKRDEYLANALKIIQDNPDRVPIRQHYLIQAYIAYMVDLDHDQAIEHYKRLLDIYPGDEEVQQLIGARYRVTERWEPALEWFEKNLSSADRSFRIIAIENVAYILQALGRYRQAENVMDLHHDTYTNQQFFHRFKGNLFLSQGRLAEALSETEESLAIDPGSLMSLRQKGHIFQIKGDAVSAEETYLQMQNDTGSLAKFEGIFWMGHLLLMQGRFMECGAEIDRSLEYAKETGQKYRESDAYLFQAYFLLQNGYPAEALYAAAQAQAAAREVDSKDNQRLALQFKSIAHLKMGKFAEAEQAAGELKALVERTGTLPHMRHYYRVMGMAASLRGEAGRAVDLLNDAVDLLPYQKYTSDNHALYFDTLAFLCLEVGDLDKAQDLYERILRLTTGRIRYGDLYAKSLYWLGKIHQQKGNPRQAQRYYLDFLSLWENADPGTAEIEDAKKQIDVMGKRYSATS